MLESLWGGEFQIPDKPKVKKIVNKIKNEPKENDQKSTEKIVKSKKISFNEKSKVIQEKVYSILGKQKDNVLCIYKKEDLHEYFQKGLDFGRIAIDTETNNSLEPITCKLMGLCLYVKGEKQVYVPVNHTNPETNERLPNQLTESDIHDELTWLIENKGNCQFIFHNGKFDYQVIKCTCNVKMPIDWDTMIGCKMLDENEEAGLKFQYINKIDCNQEKYSIEELFEGLEYSLFDPNLFALYAATDAMMTDRLYEYQVNQFKNPDLQRVYNVFKTVEMSLVEVLAEVELRGIYVDSGYAERLSKKYDKKLEFIDEQINKELQTFQPKIDAWRLTPDANLKPKNKKGDGEGKSKSEQLTNPINLASPTQLAILLYDVLKAPVVNNSKPRATGEEELIAISKKLNIPFCDQLLKRRELVKLLTTYIDTIPELAKKSPDGRVRTHFNQYGAATGRLSSSRPINLQNIPSHNKEIRLLFRAAPGYILVGSDYSQQEPRTLSQFSQDENMINAYKHGKDLYATIASGVYHNKYEDNLEFNPDGTPNPDGAKRRTSVKSLLLGIMYGRGVASIAEQIHGTVEEAQTIIDNFYKAYPKVKVWMDKTLEDAKKIGYVEDYWGRRRRLKDILLPKYTIKETKLGNSNFNPFLICEDRVLKSNLIDKYEKKLKTVRSRKQYESIRQEALKENIEIRDNGGFISQAERQCVNARIQGSAATMTKMAMIKIYNDQRLKDLDFHILINVHDELIGECPEANVEEVAKLLTEDMRTVVDGVFDVPFKCDADICYNWYWSAFKSVVLKEFLDYAKAHNNNYKEAFNYICDNHLELTRENMFDVVEGYDVN